MAFQKRKLIDSLERRKDGMIAALWANAAVEGKDREKIINDIESNFRETVSYIRGNTTEQEMVEQFESEEDEQFANEFFASAQRGLHDIKELEDTSDLDDYKIDENRLRPVNVDIDQ